MAKDIRYPSATGVWEPGESLVFDLTIGSPADVWLYRNNSFGSSASILNGLQSDGVKGSSRTSVAVDAGIWPGASDFVPNPADGDSLHLVGDPGDPANWISGAPRSGNGQNWNVFGSLPGTFTMGRQRADGVNIVTFFNQRTDASGLSYNDIQGILDNVADFITNWPTDDVAQHSPAQPRVILQTSRKKLQCPTEPGRIYQLQQSNNLRQWTDLGVHQLGDGSPVQLDTEIGDIMRTDRQFFRVEVE